MILASLTASLTTTAVLIIAFFSSTTNNTVLAELVISNTDNIDVCNAPSLNELASINADQFCIKHGGMTRCWYLYIPDSIVSTNIPTPLVLDLHGYNLCASQSAQYTDWNRIADEHGFIVVWPQGNLNAEFSNDPSWDFGICCGSLGEAKNEGEWPPAANIDDVDFLIQVLANVIDYSANNKSIVVDTKRLYFSGHSNGCMMAQSMAALRSDVVSAVCCHASSLMIPPENSYSPTSVQVIYGDLDHTIDLFFGNKSHILDTWGSINQCTANDTVVDQSDKYITRTLSNCTDDVIVETIELYNAGHFPYLGIPPDNSFTVGEYPGAVTPTVDTTLLSWDFCSSFESNIEPMLPEPVSLVAADEYVAIKSTMRPNMPSSSAYAPSIGLFAYVVAMHFMCLLAR